MSDLNRERLKAFCLDWHIDRSPAVREILIEPLQPYCEVDLVAWDGNSVSGHDLSTSSPAIFFQLPPPREMIEDPSVKVVFIPMWDQGKGYDRTWWDELPKWVRVVAFSSQLRVRAEAAGLDVLKLRYFPDPAALAPVEWDRGAILFYWNRTGMVGPELLQRFCRAVDARELIFRPEIDPRIDSRAHYELPGRLGNTKVTTISVASRTEYLQATRAANVFIAPRMAEGVGLTFLEGMARGAAVIANDAPTMNEYIRDGENGVLLRPDLAVKPTTVGSRLRSALFAHRSSQSLSVSPQDWATIAAMDMRGLGDQARADCASGHLRWCKDIPSYASFICDW